MNGQRAVEFELGAIHKGYPIFWPILDLLTYLYLIFVPNFRPIYLSISLYIPFWNVGYPLWTAPNHPVNNMKVHWANLTYSPVVNRL